MRTTPRLLTTLLAATVVASQAARGLAAGDVHVALDAATGQAHITGTASDDDITVTWDGVTGAYTIAGASGTTIDGAAAVSVTGVRSFFVEMGAGSDQVRFDHTPIPGNLNVHLDDGDDSLDLVGVSVRGGTRLFGGSGDDSIVVRDRSNFRKSLTIKGNDGDDTITVKNTKMHAYVRIVGGPRNDHMTLNAVEVDGLGDLAVQGSAGNDWLGIAASTFRRPVRVGMGPGSDLVTIETSSFRAEVDLNGGGAVDLLHRGPDVEWPYLTTITGISGFEQGHAARVPRAASRGGAGVPSLDRRSR